MSRRRYSAKTNLKKNKDILCYFIYYNLNNSLFISKLSTDLKKADVIPVDKNKDKTNIDNYRPISILPQLRKIYEKCMYDQMYSYFNPIFPQYQCAFYERNSSQNCLLLMIEK